MNMNIISLGISGIFAIAGGVFATALLVAILRNLKTARRYRRTMSDKLSSLRLSRMLSLKGIDQRTYLHTQPVLDIEQHMQRCSKCARTEQCDSVLAASNTAEETGFCDNDTELQAVKRALEAAA